MLLLNATPAVPPLPLSAARRHSRATAKSLKIGVELMPLIFSKQLNVTGVTLDAPQITLLKTANRKWNFSTIGGPLRSRQSERSPANPNLQVSRWQS